MLKYLLFIFISFYSGVSFSAYGVDVWGECTAYIATHPVYGCEDVSTNSDGAGIVYLTLIAADNYRIGTYGSYTKHCGYGLPHWNDVNKSCYDLDACASNQSLVLNPTTGYQACVSTSVTCPDGSTADGSTALSLAECPVQCIAPKVRDPVTNTCTVVCSVGMHKSLYVPMGSFPPNGIPTVKLHQNADGTESASAVKEKVLFGGCSYDIPNSPTLGCATDSAGVMYCKVTATANGTKWEGFPDTAQDGDSNVPNTPETCKSPMVWAVDHCAVPQATAGCYNVLSSTGYEEVCSETPKKNCGTISGTEVCFPNGVLTNANGFPSAIVNGEVVAATTNENGQVQNCYVGSRQVTCINVPRVGCGPGTGFVCMEVVDESGDSSVPPLIVPISSDVEEKTVTTHTTNTDGTKTEVATTTNNIVGSTATINTTEYDAAGQETSSTTQKGTATGSSSVDAATDSGEGAVAGQAGAYTGQGAFSSGTSTGAAGGHGKFYTPSGKTVDSVGTAFMAKASSSPILKTGQDIFNTQFPQLSDCGNCDFSIPELMGMAAVTMMPFCATWMPTFWTFIAAALKVATVFLAVRIMLTPTF